MNRLKPAVLMAGLWTVALAGAAAVALAAVPQEPSGPATPADYNVSIHMTDRPDGLPMRTFVSTTSRITAVVSFMDANNVNYQLRLRDLVGIEVYNDPVRLSGDGQLSRAISIDDFVASYRNREADERDALGANISALQNLCENPPGAPQPTAVPTPDAPTPIPDPFTRWRAMMLDEIVSARTTGVELDRTLRGLGTLPDVQALAGAGADLEAAHVALAQMIEQLNAAERALTPAGTGPGTPTPSPPPSPDPDAACTAVAGAVDAANQALARIQAVLAAVPDETSSWRFPPTAALYDGQQFKSCQPYVTQLYDAARSTPATSTSWTIGQPGAPALIFPSPEEIGQTDLGSLGMHLPEGANALYASTVTVPGVNQQAVISAFVTDAQCIPVDGITMTFGIDPSDQGNTVSPSAAVIHSGEVTTTLTAGFTATLGSEVLGSVDVPSTPGGPSAPPKVGRKAFSVIGPARFLKVSANPKRINRLLDEKAGIGVRVVDAYNRSVADGTRVTVSIEGSPGVLGTEYRRPNGDEERLLLGKTVDMVTVGGNGIVPDGGDPGLAYSNNLILVAGSDGDGNVVIEAEADGVREGEVVFIETKYLIHMPLAVKGFNLLATPQYSQTPIPPAVAAPRRR